MKLFMLAINQEHLNKALDSAWKGYLSLFIAMAVIFLAICILNSLSKKKKQ